MTMANLVASRLLQIAGVLTIFLSFTIFAVESRKDERDCEVCIKVLDTLAETVKEKKLTQQADIENAFRKQCAAYPKGGKENRFCYYVGGTVDAATGILGKISRPMTFPKPVPDICRALKKDDSQICELRFDVKPDFTKLNKMRVGELKKILSNWGQDNACRGCAEKSDFVKKVLELLPKHDPEEYKKLQLAKTEL